MHPSVVFGLVLLSGVVCQQLSLVGEPQSVEANEGQEVTLQCQFSGPARECVWLRDGEITIIREPYQYVGNPETGDCSIRMAQVELKRDDGRWQCQFPRLGNNPAVLSKEARVTVLVSPQDPILFYEGEVIQKGGTLSFDRPNENITVVCVSKSGNPAAQLYWMIDSRRMEGLAKNETDNQNPQNVKLYNTESQLLLIGGSDLRGSQIKCIAEHPTYNGRLHESYGYIVVHHNTTQVAAFVDGLFMTNIRVEENKEVTLYCSADGIPEPSYRWEFQRNGEVSWETWGNQQNLTVRAIAGKFVCLAGNQYNVDAIRAPEEIVIETTVPQVADKNNFAICHGMSLFVLVLSMFSSRLVSC